MSSQSGHARTSWLAVAVLLSAPAALAASGVNLSWNHCFGERTGVQNAAFACDRNDGAHLIVGSFVLDVNMPSVSGTEMVVDLAAASPSLPPWWEFKNAGSCRPFSLTASFLADPANAVCVDWTEGLAFGGLAAYCTSTQFCGVPSRGANVARIKVADAVSQENVMDLSAGTEYFSFNLVIDHAKTVGDGSCGGCAVPVCIVFNSILVARPVGLGDRRLTGPTTPGSDFITWQGGGVPVSGGLTGCPAATASRRSAWGAVKALYR